MAKAKYKKGADGYFSTKVWDGTYNEDGSKHRINLRTKQSSKALEDMANEIKEKVKNREYTISSDISVQDYAKSWCKLYKAGKSTNTKTMYDNVIGVHMECLSDVRIGDLSRSNIILALNNVNDKNRTQQQLLMTLKQVVRSAISDKYLPSGSYEDIFKDISVKRKKATEKRPLTESEKASVFTAKFTDRERAFVYLIYGCGLRRGEALALSRFDFDFKAHTVTINKAVELPDNGNTKIKTTKNGKVRTVPIPDKVFPFLEDYCKKTSGRALFVSSGKDFMTKSSYQRMWTTIQTKMNSPTLTAHIFRHNYCTQLCYQIPSISIKKIAELMGDTEKMVIEVYNHIILEKEDAKSAVEKALNF